MRQQNPSPDSLDWGNLMSNPTESQEDKKFILRGCAALVASKVFVDNLESNWTQLMHLQKWVDVSEDNKTELENLVERVGHIQSNLSVYCNEIHEKLNALTKDDESNSAKEKEDERVTRVALIPSSVDSVSTIDEGLLSIDGGRTTMSPLAVESEPSSETSTRRKSAHNILKIGGLSPSPENEPLQRGVKSKGTLALLRPSSTRKLFSVAIGLKNAIKVYPTFKPKSDEEIKLTEGELLLLQARCKESFVLIDVDFSGELSYDEVRQAVIGMNETVDDAEFDEMFTDMDTNGSNTISEDEFFGMMVKKAQRGNKGEKQENSLALLSNRMPKNRLHTSGYVSPYAIDPFNQELQVFDAMVAALLLTTFFTLPLALAFDQVSASTSMFWFGLFTDGVFLLDVAKNFFAGYINDDDLIVMELSKIRKTYMKSWFLPDFISSIPFGLFAGPGISQGKKVLKMMRLLRLMKLIRMFRMSRIILWIGKLYMDFEDRYKVSISSSTQKFVNLILIGIIVSHWLGCIQFLAAKENEFPQESWVVQAGLLEDDVSLSDQYWWSFFKAFGTIVGIGMGAGDNAVNQRCDRITSWCRIESWLNIAGLVIGSIFYAVFLANVATIVLEGNMARQKFIQELAKLNEYMRSKALPHDMRIKARQFYKLTFSSGKMFDEQEIMSKLNRSLQREILTFNASGLFERVPMLNSAPSRFGNSFATLITPEVHFAHDIVFDEGSTGDAMYFIMSGRCAIRSKYNSSSKLVLISEGCYFGDVACFYGCKRTGTVECDTLCILYSLGLDDLKKILEEFEFMRDYMKMIARKRKLRIEALNPHNKIVLAPDDIVDEEDALTSAFQTESEENEGIVFGPNTKAFESCLKKLRRQSCNISQTRRRGSSVRPSLHDQLHEQAL